MLELRSDQMQVFVDYVRTSFVVRMVKYIRENHHEVVAAEPEGELRAFVERQIANAENYGVTAEAQVAKFIEMAMAYGEDFHNSGAYPEAERILLEEVDDLTKVEMLFASALRGFEPDSVATG